MYLVISSVWATLQTGSPRTSAKVLTSPGGGVAATPAAPARHNTGPRWPARNAGPLALSRSSPLSASSLGAEVRRRRTFAIISHPDAGKTTLTEKLLLFSGAIQIAGAVKGRKRSEE